MSIYRCSVYKCIQMHIRADMSIYRWQTSRYTTHRSHPISCLFDMALVHVYRVSIVSLSCLYREMADRGRCLPSVYRHICSICIQMYTDAYTSRYVCVRPYCMCAVYTAGACIIHTGAYTRADADVYVHITGVRCTCLLHIHMYKRIDGYV